MTESIVKYKQGDLFESNDWNVLIHGCNAQGVMGSGIAKTIRDNFPQVWEDYYKEYITCQTFNNELELGHVIITPHQRINGREVTICSAITQRYYGRDGRRYVDYFAVHRALEKVFYMFGAQDVFAMPMIGGGLGGGDVTTLKQIYELAAKTTNQNNITVYTL